MFKPEDPVTVTMKAQQWNDVMAVLGRAKFNRVFNLIGEIQRQCMAQEHGNGAAPSNSHDRAEGASSHVPHR